MPEEIDGVPIREPGSVYLPEQLSPIEGEVPTEVKILVKVDSEKDDLEKCVLTATSLGGTKYFGLYKGDPVFKSELTEQEFFKQLLEAGVKLTGLFLIETYRNGFQNVRTMVPTSIKCDGCEKVIPFKSGFSRSGQSLCDDCLIKAIEPSSEED